MADKDVEFPSLSLTPKRETGVLNFLQKFGPEYDGRGVVIAILDSGVDPAAAGMKVTTTGEPKVIERYDCSGAGDVDTKTILTPLEDGTVTGFDGTVFKIPETWDNPSGTFRYGTKPLYDLYTPKMRELIEAKRKEEFWDKQQRLAAADALRTSPINNNGNNPGPQLDKLDKEESEAKLEALDLLEKKYKDYGPIIHCFMFRDASDDWNVALALSPDLTQVKLLKEYSKNQSHMYLTKDDRVTVSVNVWEDGDRLEIAHLCSGHGTHVAAIAAAYFPNLPELNGVAPGAQIISLSIGDSRLNSMETMTAVSRALCFVQKNAHRIHLLNMSYGEHSHFNGRVGELMKETIDKYGVIAFASAGNHGPALSTVTTPPFISDNNVIGVGAYVSPQMMEAEYSLREKLEAGIYTWSSRGPTLNGDIGISVCAPGGAITSVPPSLQRCAQLMNGTSMASPHCAGVGALLICAAKARNIPYSPYSMKLAMVNAALAVDSADPFSMGGGLVQVERSLEKLEMLATAPERDVRFQVSVGGSQKGIYIRDKRLAQKDYSVTVEPIFYKDNTIDLQAKIDFRLNMILVATVPWVMAPSFLDMSNVSRTFSVKVELEGLSPGVHYGIVEAFDVNGVTRGPVFKVHVTAVIPTPLQLLNYIELPLVNFEPNVIKRNFFVVPRGANFVALNLKNNGSGPCRLVVHALTLIQGQYCKAEEFYKIVTISAGEETILNFKALEDKVIEICIGRWWADAKDSIPIQTKITFKSVLAHLSEVVASASDIYARVNVTSAFQSEEIQPTAMLKHQVCLLRGSSFSLQSLSEERNAFPESKVMFELIATYPVTISRPTTITINCTLLSELLYEGEYESQLWMLFDVNKRMVGVGDAYPHHYPIKLEKGEYTLRLHVRHDKRDFLEKLVNGYPNFSGESISPTLPVLLTAKLQSNITLNVHQSLSDLQTGKKGTGWNLNLKKGTSTPIFLSTVIPEKNLKNLPCGQSTHYFTGSLLLQKDEKRALPVRLFVPEPAQKVKIPSADKPKDEILDQMRDIRVSWMSKVDKEESLKLYNELVQSHPSHLGIYTARIAALEAQLKETIEAEAVAEIQAEIKNLINLVTTQIEKAPLLAYFATKAPDAKLKQQMERAKLAFVEVNVKRGLLFPEEASEAWAEATSFCDPSDSKVVDLTVQDAIGRGHLGRALKYLLKSEDTSGEKEKKLAEVVEKLGWGGAIWWLNEQAKYKAAMKDYRLF